MCCHRQVPPTNITYKQQSALHFSFKKPPRPAISMHRTSSRPSPLDFLSPTARPTFGINRRRDISRPLSLPQITPIYFEAPIRDGLRTPPDEMATTYQQPHYTNYARSQDPTYTSANTRGNYGGAYAGAHMQAIPYSAAIQPPLSSASVSRKEEQSSQYHHSQPSSPQTAHSTSALAPPEGVPRRKSTNSDMILPNLQIPPTINNSGGSLAEFAAQVH